MKLVLFTIGLLGLAGLQVSDKIWAKKKTENSLELVLAKVRFK